MNSTPTAKVTLRSGRVAPSIYRHPWVFSGSVGKLEGDCRDGDVAEVCSDRGNFIAYGLLNQNSQIAVRLLSWNRDERLDEKFFRGKIESAIKLREQLVPLTESQTARRLIFSEGDGLPGLIADQFGEFVVVQFLSLGLDVRRDMILDEIERLVLPRGIYERGDADVREREGLPKQSGLVRGEMPPEQLRIRDGGTLFEISIQSGQKGGHYLDQRENRKAVAPLAAGRRVFDGFCYTGGFGIAASLGGAASVVCADTSGPALELARHNAELNSCANIEFVRAGVLDHLRQTNGQFDMIVLDPPPYAKSSRDVDAAMRAYSDLYVASLKKLSASGILVSCCCSQHIATGDLVRALNMAGVQTNRAIRVLETRGQPPDHPVAANCPETEYLKCLICLAE